MFFSPSIARGTPCCGVIIQMSAISLLCFSIVQQAQTVISQNAQPAEKCEREKSNRIFVGRRPADEWGSILSRSNVSDGLAIVARVARHIRARNAVAITARCRPSSRIKRKTKENDLSFDPLFICLLRRHLSRRKRESEEEEEEEEGGLICIRFG